MKKKIKLKDLSDVLNEKEMKNVVGGSGGVCRESVMSGCTSGGLMCLKTSGGDGFGTCKKNWVSGSCYCG